MSLSNPFKDATSVLEKDKDWREKHSANGDISFTSVRHKSTTSNDGSEARGVKSEISVS